MKITFVGAGNLATNLAKAMRGAGNEILQVYSRTMSSASALAGMVGAEAVDDIRRVNEGADIYIVSVKDSVLSDVVSVLCGHVSCGLFVHTAGSIPADVFKNKAQRYGVLYPMQSFSKQKEVDFSNIPFFIEANNEADTQFLHDLSATLSERVYRLDSVARKHLHLAAVFACNFANHCYELSAEVLRRYSIPFDVMLPLIDETARKVHTVSPAEAQTGPAVRFDENVIGMQRMLLEDAPRLREIYDLMSRSIHEVSNGGK